MPPGPLPPRKAGTEGEAAGRQRGKKEIREAGGSRPGGSEVAGLWVGSRARPKAGGEGWSGAGPKTGGSRGGLGPDLKQQGVWSRARPKAAGEGWSGAGPETAGGGGERGRTQSRVEGVGPDPKWLQGVGLRRARRKVVEGVEQGQT